MINEKDIKGEILETTKAEFPTRPEDSHSKAVGYILWLLGFTGSHRFYFGKPITGTIWLFTGGLLGVGWVIDLFLIPNMDREADFRYITGDYDYNISWILLTFLGVFGGHRFYLGKYLTGLLYFLSAGLFGFGILYDFWNLNELVSERNTSYE